MGNLIKANSRQILQRLRKLVFRLTDGRGIVYLNGAFPEKQQELWSCGFELPGGSKREWDAATCGGAVLLAIEGACKMLRDKVDEAGKAGAGECKPLPGASADVPLSVVMPQPKEVVL